LERMLADLEPSLPDGDILEIGCGTGLFSTTLLSLCADRHIVFSDASENLLSACRDRVGEDIRKRIGSEPRKFAPVQVSFEPIDVELNDDVDWLLNQPPFALIAGSFMLQWVSDLDACLDALTQMLMPGGYLLFSVPGAQSFPEWKRICNMY